MESKLASIERQEFCARLVSALMAAGCPTAPTALARGFNGRAGGAAVTVHGARKWLTGDSFPTQERLHVLARWLNVSPQWLRFGEPPEPSLALSDASAIHHKEVLLLDDFSRLDENSQAVVRELIGFLLKHYSLRI